MKRTLGILFLALAGGALPGSVRAETTSETSAPSRPNLVFHLGVAAYNLNRTTKAATGATTLLGPVEPFLLGVTWRQPYSNGWSFEPTFHLNIIGRGSADGAGRWRTFGLLAPFVTPGGSFAFRFGPGLLFSLFSGSGGTSVLNNGNSTTTFYLPSGSSMSTNFVVTGGFLFWFSDQMRMDVNAIISGLLSSRRAVGMLIEVGHGI